MVNLNHYYIHPIVNRISNLHPTSYNFLIEAWDEMEQHKDVCFAKTADDIIEALGWLADLYNIHGKQAGKVLRKICLNTNCCWERYSLTHYIANSLNSRTGDPNNNRSYKVIQKAIYEINMAERMVAK